MAILADDLTGALDAAAPFADRGRSVAVLWRPEPADSDVVAWDMGTRDGDAAQARAATAGFLAAAAGRNVYLKIDSVLRGHPAATIAQAIAAIAPDRCIIAPAFPAHGRVTGAGRHYAPDADGALVACTPLDLPDVAHCRPGMSAPTGTSLWDAETDLDLDRIVAAGRTAPGRTLWCGSGGLFAALARADGPAIAADHPRPTLALIGTDHPVTASQIADAGAHHIALTDYTPTPHQPHTNPRIITVAHPPGTPRSDAATRVARALRTHLDLFAEPAFLVSGGETLRALCEAAGTERLDIQGEAEPGLPVSIARGGRLDGSLIYSKSGGFGDRLLLQRLFRASASTRNLQ